MAVTGLITLPTCVASAFSQQNSPTCSTLSNGLVSFGSRKLSHLKNVEKGRKWRAGVIVAMAPEDEKMTRRSPLDFPVEWDRPSPGRRPDIFPQFSPMKTPLPPPLPTDPPEEDEEEDDKKEEDDPDKEDKPEE